MLARAALRLAAIEALCPTAAIASGEGFPTLAGWRVFDSAAISPDALIDGAAYTPCLSVYTEDTRIDRRGETSSSVSGDATIDLVVVAELAEIARDEEGNPLTVNGATTADAVIDGDVGMRLKLEALGAQVRQTLVRAPAGSGFRRVMKAVRTIRIEPFGLPQYGVRFMRDVITFTLEVADDKYSDLAGLPEPLRSVAAELPEGSYAKAKLAELAGYFLPTPRVPIAGFDVLPSVEGSPGVVRPPSAP